jgi:hypothetical protein
MKRLMTISLSIVLFIIMTLTLSPTANAESFEKHGILLKINGAYLIYSSGVMPYVDASYRTMVPARIIADSLGGIITWNAKTKTLILNAESIKIEAQMDAKSVQINGNSYPSDSAMTQKNGTTMIPINWIAKGLSVPIEVNSKYGVISLNHPDFFLKGKLELMNDETGKDNTFDVNVVPVKMYYKKSKDYDWNFLNIDFVNLSKDSFSVGTLQDHLIAPVNKANFINLGSKGEVFNDTSTIRSLPEIKPNEVYTHEIGIREFDKLPPGKAEYAFLRYFKLITSTPPNS